MLRLLAILALVAAAMAFAPSMRRTNTRQVSGRSDWAGEATFVQYLVDCALPLQ